MCRASGSLNQICNVFLMLFFPIVAKQLIQRNLKNEAFKLMKSNQ